MSTEAFQSRQALLSSRIDTAAEKLRSAAEMVLPGSDAHIVALSVERIQGSYDVTRAKRDTDHAVDLLYIAYNTTPQKHGGIRVQISSLMSALIKAQQDSALAMSRAIATAKEINGILEDSFPEWLDIRGPVSGGTGTPEQIDELRGFIKTDLTAIAERIRSKALDMQKSLLDTATAYGKIIEDAERVTSHSELALSENINEREALQREIDQNNAQREKLGQLVADLQTEVEKFDRMAKDFEAKANTAEERAFVMSIVRVAAGVVSSVVAPIAMLGSGGVLGAATRSTTPARGDTGGGEDAEAQATAQSKLADLQSERRSLKTETETLQQEIAQLKADSKPDEQVTEPKTEARPGEMAQAALDARIREREQALADRQARLATLDEAIGKLEAAMAAASKAVGQLSDEQRAQESNLREMQMRMLERAEAFEKERRTQAAELMRINVLLKGQQTQEETLQLAVQSLSLSIGALKRMQEIVKEIAFFFQSFADFMAAVASDAGRQLERFEQAQNGALRTHAMRSLVQSTDTFFIKQAADWHAAGKVSGLFNQSFANGWSRLNKLSGTYLTGPALAAYLREAGTALAQISEERQQRSSVQIAEIQQYREKLATKGRDAA
jgi:chromosome segregation ATPase